MKILVLAPQPFYKERGTPIAVYQLLRVFSERPNLKIDVLTYHEGEKIHLSENIKIHRIPELKYISQIKPGFSLKKIICDIFMFFCAWFMILENKYDLIHAVEESVFFAMCFKSMIRVPYVYDLDSSLAQQVIEGARYLKTFKPLFNFLEKKAIQGSTINLPVCNALVELCNKNGSAKTMIVPDISLLNSPNLQSTGFLKRELGINSEILIYIGNLEIYQGIDLLLDSFKLVTEKTDNLDLVIIGGTNKQIDFYMQKAQQLGIENKTHFLGPRPLNKLQDYLAEADIIASPRIRGVNTPMKIYSFLHSGRPVIATNLYTHTQMITDKEALLVPPVPEEFAKGLLKLLNDKALREYLGRNGACLIENNCTFQAHRKRIHNIYDWIENYISAKFRNDRYYSDYMKRENEPYAT